ncbi:MAG: flavodoxin family protein [Bacteroidales bacterium]|nr:flavodoxin family protein [Bacteroidales bacterium]
MKVLLLNGSPRPNGNTATMLAEVAAQLSKNGLDSELVHIGNAPIRGCIACNQCHAGNLGRCFFDDDVTNGMIAKMAECDAIVVGAPVYYGVPAGQVLSVLQRMAYSAGRVMQGKPAAAVTVCRRGGASASFQTLQMPFQMLNMPIVTSQYWNIGYGSAPGEVSRDAEGLQTMRTLADNLAYMLKQFATGKARTPEREQWITTNFIK